MNKAQLKISAYRTDTDGNQITTTILVENDEDGMVYIGEEDGCGVILPIDQLRAIVDIFDILKVEPESKDENI